ncbi:hypothetical protein PanWU01x14_070970 [Parasponia andersonii]|uniref:Uncharacterized protein n=1 Tax=Parasponia andersonii TaxID=3476 RepID=A0A2P5DEE7_PARAD|nr:hypothetical protein PanWU01x14_070970 [Parasponia andersonii]
MLPIIPTRTGTISKMVKSSTIPDNNLPAINLRYELKNNMTVYTDSQILQNPNGSPWSCINKHKSHCNFLTVIRQSSLLFLLLYVCKNIRCTRHITFQS